MADEKLKILWLRELLLEETDGEHALNAAQITEKMESRYGCTCNRKTVYADVERLRSYGMRIEQSRGQNSGYYVKHRDFELPELKLLVDAVQSSKFITKERSEELIRKLEKETSREYAKQLRRQVFIYNRIKAGNEAIYKNVDAIHTAIQNNLQIGFRYCEWTVRKELHRRRDGAEYIISPWALTWDDENYYLVGFDAEKGMIRHYRVDKMQEMRITDQKRRGRENFAHFDLAAFARKTFGMFGGEDRDITLEAENHLAGVLIDRFGTDIIMVPHGGDRFHTAVTVTVSPQFFGWLAGIGKGIRILRPEEVREQYREYLRDIVESS